MTDNIKALEEALRAAKEEKIISEGGFRCVRCGRILRQEYRFSVNKVKNMWVVDPDKYTDPSLKDMCYSCAESQFEGISGDIFRRIIENPQDIVVVKLDWYGEYRKYRDFPVPDSRRLNRIIFKVDDLYFELENEDRYDQDSCPYVHFIGREGDENIKNILKEG